MKKTKLDPMTCAHCGERIPRHEHAHDLSAPVVVERPRSFTEAVAPPRPGQLAVARRESLTNIDAERRAALDMVRTLVLQFRWKRINDGDRLTLARATALLREIDREEPIDDA